MASRFMFNPFDLFGLEPGFSIDLKALDKSYFSLQKMHHPDKIYLENNTLSSDLNAAYHILKNPTTRAAAVLKALGLPVPGEEGRSLTNSEALLQIFEFQETIRLCENAEQIDDIREEVEELFVEEQHDFSQRFDHGHYEVLPDIYIKLSYLDKLRKQIDEAENLFFEHAPLLH